MKTTPLFEIEKALRSIGLTLDARYNHHDIQYLEAMKQTDHSHMSLIELSDRNLIEATSRWRSAAFGGTPESAQISREHEDELTRRFGGATTLAANLGDDPGRTKRPWWKI